MNNTQKTIKNSAISVTAQIVTLLLQFINRRVFVVFLDIEFLGYQTVFSNVFSILSVAELGIGSIISFQLYKEVVNKNQIEIGKLMYLYKWLYRVVACLVTVAGLICYFFLPLFVKDAKASWDYLHLIYFLQLAGVVCGYFLSYRRTILIATQQEYKSIKIDLWTNIIIQTIQLISLALFRNYIVYLIIALSTGIISNIWIYLKTNAEFPYLKNKFKITKDDIKKRNIFSEMGNFLFHQICYTVYGGTDNIVISAFCGIRNVALYGNYNVVKVGVMQVLFYRLLNPVQATIGNIVYSDRPKKELWKQFEMLDVFSFFFATYIGLGFFLFYQPFIQLWMGKEYLLDDAFVILFSMSIYFGAVWEIVYKYRSVFGDYKQDRWFMFLSAVLNIGISIPGAMIWGIPGVQLGTLIAFLSIAYGRIRFVVKNYFEQSIGKYLLKHLMLFVVVGIEGVICYFLVYRLPVSFGGILLRGLAWLIIPGVINVALLWRNHSFKEMVSYLKRIVIIMLEKVKLKKSKNW